MNIKNALIDLDNSWSRDIILEKIEKGQTTDKIVNDFIKSNKSNIELVSNYVEENNENILDNIEKLSICEIKLINEIKNFYNLVQLKAQRKIVTQKDLRII